ncbi:hypothetical protein A3K73_06570 [Candidatus Pacearchaeota archaeon RBG_13_36_9]|nr:MAG: hypothetical protein A3K73_06570 [Candidatus Pacearchaeota archaeon RBG_13_36_9]
MTERLSKFWEYLNKGFIDWGFLESDAPAEERRKAKEWVVERGFVKLFEKGKFPQFNALGSPYFAVADSTGTTSFPMIDGKTVIFTKSGYAHDYASYLNRVDKTLGRDYEGVNLNSSHLRNIGGCREFKFD